MVGAPISVGDQPEGVAITPDGLHALVAQKGGDVSIVDTATRAVVATVTDAAGPSRIAVGPRGGRAFVTDSSLNTVTAFNPDNGAVVDAPMVGAQPSAIAIEPSGGHAYVVAGDGTLTPITTSTDAPGGQVTGFNAAAGIAIEPSGTAGYVTNSGSGFDQVTGFNTASNGLFGPFPVGATPAGIAIVPDQGPTASLFVSPRQTFVKHNVTFNAAASRDPDGKIADYAWDFGDGSRVVKGSKSLRRHSYRRPGTYQVTLTVTDDEGCSTDFVLHRADRLLQRLGRRLDNRDDRHRRQPRPGPAASAAAGDSASAAMSTSSRSARESRAVRAPPAAVLTVTKLRHRRRVVRVVRHFGRLVPAGSALSPGAWKRLALRVPPGTRRAAARALRSGGRAVARLTVTAFDSTGLKTVHRRTVRLFGPHPNRHPHPNGHR